MDFHKIRIKPTLLLKRASPLSTPFTAIAAGLLLAGCMSEGVRVVDGQVGNAASFVAGPRVEPTPTPIFVASTRRTDGPDDGRAHYSLTTIGVPANHRTGWIERPTFGGPDRRRHFTLLDKRNMGELEFFGEFGASVGARHNRDVLLYVHGFNIGLEEARYRLAQIVADGRFGGAPALFTWNSRGGLFAYEADREAATVSRDTLEKFILDIARTQGVSRVHILAHSMGAWLTMEALRSIAISGHPDLDGRLGQVMLASPDIDLNVFRQQVARLDPKRISIFVANNDRALSISSRIAGDRPRLGAMDPSKPEDQAELERLGVAVHDISAFSTDWLGHGAFAEAPDVVQQIGAHLAPPVEGPPLEAAAPTDATPRTGAISSPTPEAAAPTRSKIETEPLPPAARQ